MAPRAAPAAITDVLLHRFAPLGCVIAKDTHLCDQMAIVFFPVVRRDSVAIYDCAPNRPLAVVACRQASGVHAGSVDTWCRIPVGV